MGGEVGYRGENRAQKIWVGLSAGQCFDEGEYTETANIGSGGKTQKRPIFGLGRRRSIFVSIFGGRVHGSIWAGERTEKRSLFGWPRS